MTTLTKSQTKKILTLANKITIFRIVLIPVIVICLLQEQKILSISLLVFSILTDMLDGLAARLMKERTRLGAFLDPLADKLLITSIFMVLTYLGAIETWAFVIIFSRDLLIVLGWTVIYILTGSSNIFPRVLGKVTTAAQMGMALAILVGIPQTWTSILLWVTIGLTIASSIDYLLIGEKNLGYNA